MRAQATNTKSTNDGRSSIFTLSRWLKKIVYGKGYDRHNRIGIHLAEYSGSSQADFWKLFSILGAKFSKIFPFCSMEDKILRRWRHKEKMKSEETQMEETMKETKEETIMEETIPRRWRLKEKMISEETNGRDNNG